MYVTMAYSALCFKKTSPFLFFNNSVTHQLILIKFVLQHREETSYKYT